MKLTIKNPTTTTNDNWNKNITLGKEQSNIFFKLNFKDEKKSEKSW